MCKKIKQCARKKSTFGQTITFSLINIQIVYIIHHPISFLYPMKNLIDAYKSGFFSKQQILPNIVAGIIVAVVALPLAMAFAIASGAKPEQGLYTAIIAGLIVSVFGGSNVQIAGPTGAFVVVLINITNKYGIDGLQIATFLAGIMLLLFGIARLGLILRFIPTPVIVGFTAGIGTVIWVSQWEYFFGFHLPKSEHFHQTLMYVVKNIENLNLHTTIIGIISLLTVIFANKIVFLKKIPGPLIALILATLLQITFNFPDVATIGSKFGGIPQHLPEFKFFHLNFDIVLELIGPAFTIAMLGAIESLLSAVVADGMSSTKHNSNRELIGQGLANIIAPLFGGFAATGAIARTATNIRNGGTSPLSGIVHSIVLILIIIILAPLATNIPLTCLAAILFWVAWNMSQVSHVAKLIKKAPKSDVLILLITYLLTVFIDLVVAVNIGVILAVFNFLLKMSQSVAIKPHSTKGNNLSNEVKKLPDDVVVYSVNGPLFFAAIENFEKVLKATHNIPNVLILSLGWVPFIDTSGIEALEEIIGNMHKQKTRIIITGLNDVVFQKLLKADIINLLGTENIFTDLDSAIEALNNNINSQENVILPA